MLQQCTAVAALPPPQPPQSLAVTRRRLTSSAALRSCSMRRECSLSLKRCKLDEKLAMPQNCTLYMPSASIVFAETVLGELKLHRRARPQCTLPVPISTSSIGSCQTLPSFNLEK